MDFALNAILLLLLLSLSASNCKELHKEECEFDKLVQKLTMTKLWSLESSREKLTQLQARVAHSGRADAE